MYVRGARRVARPLRIDAFLHVATREEVRERARPLIPLRRRGVRAVGIKIFSDGSLGGRTAALQRLRRRRHDGRTAGGRNALRDELEACAMRSIACAVHAIGDRALRTVLDAMGDPRALSRARALSHRARGGDRRRRDGALRALRIPLVMQPNFVRNWGGEDGMYDAAPRTRALGAKQPVRDPLARQPARRCSRSDGMPAGPLFGLRGATHHAIARERIARGGGVLSLHPSRRRRLRRLGGGRVRGRPLEGGSRPAAAPTSWSLSGNPLLADLDRLRVEATIRGGREVYRAPAPTHSKRSR